MNTCPDFLDIPDNYTPQNAIDSVNTSVETYRCRHNIKLLLATIQNHFKSNRIIHFTDLSLHSGLSLDDVKTAVQTLKTCQFISCDHVSIFHIEKNAFQMFGINTQTAAQLKADIYQASEKRRKHRKRVKNNPDLVKTFGNKCGHDKKVLPVFKLPENSKKRPPCIALLFKKLSNYFNNPKCVLHQLNNANGKTTQHGELKQQRTERREACILLLGAMLSRLDIDSMRVGCPLDKGKFVGITLDKLAEIAGISFSRAERAYRDIVKSGLIKTFQKCEKLADGTYKGMAAIRKISATLFKEFGLSEELAECQERLRRKMAKKSAVIPVSLKDLVKQAENHQTAAVAAGFTPQSAAFASIRDILKT